MIRAAELTKVFKDKKRGEIKAVDRVSFVCEPGVIYGLLGPNGAGKTTTLRLLSTALRPTSGTAFIDGVDVTKDPQAARRRIGFLSGTTGLYGRLSPVEMVRYFGRLYGMSGDAIAERTNKLFDLLDMHDFSHARNEKLSGGMKQKVSIARSVVHDPPIMVFDEPTTGLDVMSSRTIVQFIRRCADEGKTVIFSTHIMSEAVRLCDKVGIIHNGRLYVEGTVPDILTRTGRDNLEDAFINIVGE
ncbi:MAG TPA: ATP-binding cassette domain-containing protein [Candidatus Deferrimicrobium sp.]|nr:ATP-binding cassette domain-containing protein [Candidatus Deferrimicrobium sp.]